LKPENTRNPHKTNGPTDSASARIAFNSKHFGRSVQRDALEHP
jgi:hypothetical protein